MRRRWVFAVVVSTAFHVALIIGFRVLVARAQRADAAEAAAKAPPAAAPPPSTQVEFIRVGVVPRAAAAAPERARPVTPGVGPAAAPPAMAPTDAEAGRPGVDAVPVELAGTVEVAPEHPVEVAETGPSAELIALVQARLGRGAAKCYPAAAQRFRQRGVVSVSFCASATGSIDVVTLGTSSGSALLDRAATDCVVQSANPLPAKAAGACFRLPVRFGEE